LAGLVLRLLLRFNAHFFFGAVAAANEDGAIIGAGVGVLCARRFGESDFALGAFTEILKFGLCIGQDCLLGCTLEVGADERAVNRCELGLCCA
jgi:hypothetical protein